MKKTEIIGAILDLLDAPEKWIRQASARAADGRTVRCDHPDAVAWCLAGAMGKVANIRVSHTCYPLWWIATKEFLDRRCRLEYGVSSVIEVNDIVLKDYEDMRLFLKRALLEAEELESGAEMRSA